MCCKEGGARVKIVVAVVVIALFTGGWNDEPAPASSHSWWEKPVRNDTPFWARKGRDLPKNPRLELEDGEHGFALTPDELPPSLLVIDVEKSGRVSIPYIGVVSDEVVTKEVKERVDKYGTDFPCMIRADKNTPHEYIAKVMNLCAVGGMWKFSFVAGLPQSEDGRRSGFSKLNAIRPSPDDVLPQEEVCDEVEPPPAELPLPETEPPPDMDLDVQVDTPSVSPVEVTEVAPPMVEPPPAKTISVDEVLSVKSPITMKRVSGTARTSGRRSAFIRGGTLYGDANTERAVMKALRWLKATQAPDGSWGTKPELGLTKGMDKAAGAGFAVLTFLAHGETPASKEFGPTVEKAINYLVNNVYVVKDKDGNEVKDPNDLTPYVKMFGAGGAEYGFLIGTYALCEAYAMTKNPNARVAAEKALARIISGQTPTGGWNYNMKRTPSEGAPDDISFGGWAMQALKAGKMAGIHLPGMDECIKKAVKCLKTRNYSEKAGFVYRATTNHRGGGGGLAGAGCLAMQLLGYAKEPEVANALRVMADWQPSLDKEYPYVRGMRHNPQYYCYYAAQCKYQAGMARNATPENLSLWKKWNAEMKNLYPKSMITVMDPKTNKPYTIQDVKGKPREIGHWVNQDTYNYDVMGTCLAALQLMVYYRYLPTTMLRAAEVEMDVVPLSKDKSGEVNVKIDI